MDSTDLPTKKCTSPLLALPLDIMQQIIDYLTECDVPMHAVLRRTHRCFYHIIHPSTVRDKPSEKLLRDQLRWAETQSPYLFPPDHYPCWQCLRVKPAQSFPDRSKDEELRCCLKCGIEFHLYPLASPVIVDGVSYRHRIPCNQGTDLSGHLYTYGRGVWPTMSIFVALLLLSHSLRDRSLMS